MEQAKNGGSNRCRKPSYCESTTCQCSTFILTWLFDCLIVGIQLVVCLFVCLFVRSFGCLVGWLFFGYLFVGCFGGVWGFLVCLIGTARKGEMFCLFVQFGRRTDQKEYTQRVEQLRSP